MSQWNMLPLVYFPRLRVAIPPHNPDIVSLKYVWTDAMKSMDGYLRQSLTEVTYVDYLRRILTSNTNIEYLRQLLTTITYDKPSICPSTISMRSACGDFGKPGIRRIVPAMATIISAPRLMTILRM